VERLQDAINRARLERQGEIGKLGQYSPARRTNTASEPNRPATKAQPSAQSSSIPGPPPANIVYTQTRQVELDEHHIERNRVIAGQQGDQRVEAYRQLRTQVLHTLDKNNWHTLAITSPMKNAGKTLTAVNLAISLSKEVNHSVLLVDLDLSHPNVHSTLGVEIEWGLIDALEGRATLDQVLFNPGMQRLVVLPGKPMLDYSSEILSSPAMKSLMLDITRRYESRIVIFDLPPLLRNDDALKFTPFADATLMVIEAGVNNPDEIERSLHLMQNANLVGTILNKTRL